MGIGPSFDFENDIQPISYVPGKIESWSNTIRYLDMNSSNGGVDRNASIANSTWTNVYSYSGSGYLASFIVNIETFTLWRIRIIVDGIDILIGSNGILTDDITSDTIYDLDADLDISMHSIGLSKGSHDRILFNSPLIRPIYFQNSIEIKLKREAGAASKKFQAGLILLSKET